MSLLVDSKRWKIVEFFLLHPMEEVHLRALARRLHISPTWIAKTLPSLVQENLLLAVKNKERRVVTIKANREHSAFSALKLSYNVYSLLNSGVVQQLIENYQKPECIILFGSYRRGEDAETSDIDIAVITGKTARLDLRPFEKKLLRKIKIVELKKGKIEPEFMNTLANGIVLYGYLDVRS